MKNCKNFKIFKFKYAIPVDTSKQRVESMRRANLMTNFKIKFIDAFAEDLWETMLHKQYKGDYKDQPDYYLSPYERGLEQIENNHGTQWTIQSSSWYIAIPLANKKMIEFMDKNTPDYVTTVQKI
jgi:hypothetical protein